MSDRNNPSQNKIPSVVEAVESRLLFAAGDELLSIRAVNDGALRDSGQAGIFRISRSDATEAVTVPLGVGGTAANGTDFGIVGNALTFAEGVDSIRLRIRPAAAATPDQASAFVFIALGEVDGYIFETQAATLSLRNDASSANPAMNGLTFETRQNATGNTGSASTLTGSTAGRFLFTRTGDLSQALTLPITVGGTGLNGTDFGRIGDSITFAPDSDSVRLNVRAGVPTFADDRTVSLSTVAVPGLISSGTFTDVTLSGRGSGGTVGGVPVPPTVPTTPLPTIPTTPLPTIPTTPTTPLPTTPTTPLPTTPTTPNNPIPTTPTSPPIPTTPIPTTPTTPNNPIPTTPTSPNPTTPTTPTPTTPTTPPGGTPTGGTPTPPGTTPGTPTGTPTNPSIPTGGTPGGTGTPTGGTPTPSTPTTTPTTPSTTPTGGTTTPTPTTTTGFTAAPRGATFGTVPISQLVFEDTEA